MDSERLCRQCNNSLPARQRGRPWVFCDVYCRATYKQAYDKLKQREHRAKVAQKLARLEELERLVGSA